MLSGGPILPCSGLGVALANEMMCRSVVASTLSKTQIVFVPNTSIAEKSSITIRYQQQRYRLGFERVINHLRFLCRQEVHAARDLWRSVRSGGGRSSCGLLKDEDEAEAIIRSTTASCTRTILFSLRSITQRVCFGTPHILLQAASRRRSNSLSRSRWSSLVPERAETAQLCARYNVGFG